MEEIGVPKLLTSALPFGSTRPRELDHWPEMRKWVSRRFGAIRLRAMATSTDPESRRLRELCDEIVSRPRNWRARFFDDLETCSWVQTFSEGMWRSRTPPVDRLRFLIDRAPSAYVSTGAAGVEPPAAIVTRSPGQYGDVFPPRAPNAPLSVVSEDQRLLFEKKFTEVLFELGNCWRGMLKIVVHHIKAVAITTDRNKVISSNRYYPGILFLGQARIDQLSCEEVVHEAIHQALFCLEGQGAFQPSGIKDKFTSVWSGKDLNASVYFHLPVVYYGLFILYAKLDQNGSPHSSDERLHQIATGLRSFFAEAVRDHWLTPRGKLVFEELGHLMEADPFFAERSIDEQAETPSNPQTVRLFP